MNQSTPPFRVLGVVSAVPYKYFGTASAVPYVSNAVSDYRNPLPRVASHSITSQPTNVAMPGDHSLIKTYDPYGKLVFKSSLAGGALKIPRSKVVFPQRGGALGVPASKINRYGGLLVGSRRQFTRVRV